jgi:tetratricopeptide (TPR) repeat protein
MSRRHVDELERIEMPDGFVWRPVRRAFDIRAFGVNAYSVLEAGAQIVEEHELGAGQLVFVRDPALKRGAVALDADTVVLAMGGKAGEPFAVSAWEAMFAAVPAAREERWDEAIRIHEEALEEQPDHPALLYNLACMEARAGRRLDALLHLQRSVEIDPAWAEHARKDSDFAAIRSEPGFP